MPDDVAFVDEIPHTATGKILKSTLRDAVQGLPAADGLSRALTAFGERPKSARQLSEVRRHGNGCSGGKAVIARGALGGQAVDLLGGAVRGLRPRPPLRPRRDDRLLLGARSGRAHWRSARCSWPAAGFFQLWTYGDRGGISAARAVIVALLVLSPFLVSAWRVYAFPRLSDISTDVSDPPPLDAAAALCAPRGMNPVGADLGRSTAPLQADAIPTSPDGAIRSRPTASRNSPRAGARQWLDIRRPAVAADRRRRRLDRGAGQDRRSWRFRSTSRSASPTRATPPMSTCARPRATAATISATTPPASPVS